MLNKKVSFISLILLFLLTPYLKAEKILSLKYGHVSIEELQMTKYDLDTSARAVVLYQNFEFIPQQFNFAEHYRIKVLKKTGTGLASMVFTGKLKGCIKGCTYNLEDGKVVKSKLENESIFEERVVGDIYRTRIALPNVKVGSVFEVYIYMNGLPFSIDIQRNIPVKYSALYFPQNPNINIRIREIGYLGYSQIDNETWVSKDLPAFNEEPFITSENDYRKRIEFELVDFKFTGIYRSYFASFASYWSDVNEYFNESDYFGKRINDFTLYLNGLSDSIKTISKNDEELVKNAFDAIKTIKWNGQETCFTSQYPSQTYKLKQGNSADININLIMLLRKLGLKSYPVLFSSRDNGKILRYSPTIVKFNYVIAAVDLADGTKYLDATDEFYPYDLASERVSCCWGHPIEKGKADCSVYIEPVKKKKKSSYSQFTIDSIGNISGKISIKRFDYSAVEFKNMLKSKPDQNTYIQELEAENTGWTISNFNFTNLKDPYQDFVDQYDVNYSNILGTANEIVFNPLVFLKSDQNPFQKEKRLLPVSFPQLMEYSSRISITIPSNYKVSELPSEINITNDDKSVRYVYQIKSVGNTISISTKFSINKLVFDPTSYPSLRSLYENMLLKQSESIILKRV